MNKPATKEPSMDEILSSIRQIIADDDASLAPAAARPVATAPAPMPPRPVAAAEPLPLSAAQIVAMPEAEPAPPPMQLAPPRPMPSSPPMQQPTHAELAMSPSFADDPMLEMPEGEPELLDPEDIDFDAEPVFAPPPPVLRTATVTPPAPAPRPAAASVSRAAPMPDPTLSADMAEQLLAPTTDAAVKGTMARLNAASVIGGSQTIEGLMREMMRPMLKEWLDENLPALVERVVEREIVRISRGVK